MKLCVESVEIFSPNDVKINRELTRMDEIRECYKNKKCRKDLMIDKIDLVDEGNTLKISIVGNPIRLTEENNQLRVGTDGNHRIQLLKEINTNGIAIVTRCYNET